jgi:hypothetical protein
MNGKNSGCEGNAHVVLPLTNAQFIESSREPTSWNHTYTMSVRLLEACSRAGEIGKTADVTQTTPVREALPSVADLLNDHVPTLCDFGRQGCMHDTEIRPKDYIANRRSSCAMITQGGA